jgi:hypothetical protein
MRQFDHVRLVKIKTSPNGYRLSNTYIGCTGHITEVKEGLGHLVLDAGPSLWCDDEMIETVEDGKL